MPESNEEQLQDTIERDIELGRELLTRLFRAVEISTVVVVDDDYQGGVDPGVVVDRLVVLPELESEQDARSELLRQIGVEPSSDNWIQEATERFAAMGEDERLLKFQAIVAHAGESGARFPGRLPELIEAPTRLVQLSPAGWERNRERLIAEAQKGEIDRKSRTLFLFDLHLGPSEPKGRTGLQLLQELRNATKGTPVLCGIISRNFSVDEEEKSAAEGAAGGVPPVYLSKDRLDEQPQTFAEGVRRTAMADGIQRLIKAALNVLKEAHEHAEEELQKLNANNLERVVVELSQQEGIWEADTLFRVYNLHLRRQARVKARTDGALSAALKEVRGVDSIDVVVGKPKKVTASNEAKRLQALELYEEGEDINRFNFPLELGDVFELPDGDSAFILLGQPCDLSLRTRKGGNAGEDAPKAERKLRDPWVARLVKQKPDSNSLAAHFYLPVFGTDFSDRWVDFRTAEPAPLEILDLAAFNLFGTFSMAVDQPPPEDLLPAWGARYQELRDRYREGLAKRGQWLAFIDRVKEQQVSKNADANREPALPIDVPQGAEDLADSYLPLHLLLPATRIAGDEVVYAGRRVRRLAQPYAGVLLIKFARYRSREAFELNLAR